MRFLVTGFEPFGGETRNVSWEAVRALPAALFGAEIVTARLPVEYDGVMPVLLSLMEAEDPDAVLCVGLAANRDCLTPERRAVNRMASKIADNAGVFRDGQPILPGGPESLFSDLPVEKMAEAMSAAGIPARVSGSAGTFVCNRVMYGLLSAIAAGGRPRLGGFLHVPRETAVPFPQICRGLEIGLQVIAEALS